MSEKTIKTYITYFDDRQIAEYNLKEDENTILFKGNDTSYPGKSINNLNTFYCELCTLYYVWKNNLKSDYVVFKQYRRPFEWEKYGRLPKDGEAICFKYIPLSMPIILQYAFCHGKKRAFNLINTLKELYGLESEVYKYFSGSKEMFTNNSMVLTWDDFTKMCEFVFGVLDRLDKHYRLNYNYQKYERNAKEFTEDGRFDYQMHWVAYIGERLVSCYIHTHLKQLMIPRLNGNGFYKPYETKKESD